MGISNAEHEVENAGARDEGVKWELLLLEPRPRAGQQSPVKPDFLICKEIIVFPILVLSSSLKHSEFFQRTKIFETYKFVRSSEDPGS